MRPVAAPNHHSAGTRSTLGRPPPEIRAVLEALEASGTRVAFLHPADGFGPRHDVDIAVDQRIERVEPTIVRALEAVGFTHVTTMEYDVGGSESLVFARTTGSGLQAVAIDVVHDPRGIGKYGIPMAPVLESAIVRHGFRSPTRAWEAVYLLSKRVRKGGWEKRLHRLPGLLGGALGEFERAARIVMGPRWAARLVARLGDGSTVVRSAAEAAQIRRAITLRRFVRDPWNPFRRCSRAVRRLRRPTGLYVTICGVDGSGKSTLAMSLLEEAGPLFRRTLRLHWRPDLLPRLGSLAGRPTPDADCPHEADPSGVPTALLRLLYYWIDHVLGYWVRIWPARLRSGLVIMERGFLDIKVDPRRYRMRAAGSLVDALARVVPRSDVQLVLAAPPDLIRRRKQELSKDEVRRQTAEWTRIARSSGRARVLDGARPPHEVLAQALRALLDRHP
jgi:thymidylate kinase